LASSERLLEPLEARQLAQNSLQPLGVIYPLPFLKTLLG